MELAERAALHTRLDQLLDRRERIEAHVMKYPMRFAPEESGYLDARSAYEDMIALVRALMGPIIPWRVARRGGGHGVGRSTEKDMPAAVASWLSDHQSLDNAEADLPPEVKIWLKDRMRGRPSEANTLLALRDWLELHAALLRPAGTPPEVRLVDAWGGATVILGNWSLDAAHIEAELGALIRGETSDLFAAAARLPGQPAKPTMLAMARLMALVMDRFFAAENSLKSADMRVAAATWRTRIAFAFGVGGWSTIEKWDGLCRQYLGDWIVDHMLYEASRYEPTEHRNSGLDAATTARGAEFQQIARDAKGGERNRRQPRQTRPPTI